MELKKQEQDLQFSIWLIASIFLHILLIIIILFWYFQTSLQRLFLKKKPEQIQKKLTDQQLLQLKKEEARKNPILWKDLKKPEKKEDIQYTLIPGRQAITESKSENTEKSPEPQKEKQLTESIAKKAEPKKEKQITPEQKTTQAKENQPEQSKQDVQSKEQEHPTEKPVKQSKKRPSWSPMQEKINQQNTFQTQNAKTQAVHQQITPKTSEERHDDLKEKLLKEAKLKAEQQILEAKNQIALAESQSTQKTNTNNPSIVKNKITLKDLQLGFSKFMQEGNNDILLQKGNTNQSPDAQALRLITYQQQFARTMREAIVTHHQYHLVEHVRGTRPTYTITIDRSGKLLDFQLMTSSGNELLDRIMKEALQTVRLYPALPQHITGDTFSHAWTFLH